LKGQKSSSEANSLVDIRAGANVASTSLEVVEGATHVFVAFKTAATWNFAKINFGMTFNSEVAVAIPSGSPNNLFYLTATNQVLFSS